MSVCAAGRLQPKELLKVAERVARAGADVILAAADKPRSVQYKGTPDNLVTDTDAAAESACVAVIVGELPDHAILGEEGGLIRQGEGAGADYLWVLDPLDGTTNFTHGYRGFCVSVGVLRHSTPVAGVIIEFTGGPGDWNTRTYSAFRNGGATCNGRPLAVSATAKLQEALVATELCWHESTWPELAGVYKELTRRTRGLRASGSAALNLAHVASGVTDAYFQYMLKPWDVAAGALILEEAGGVVTTADGLAWNIYDKSLLATNDALHGPMQGVLEPRHASMQQHGVDLAPYVVSGVGVKTGAQLE